MRLSSILPLLSFIIIEVSGIDDPEKRKPNIVFFLVDDLGWNDVGYHGLKQIPTPNIDTLAANGLILNNYYTAPACSPSRSALMSGMYPTTTGLQHLVIEDAQAVGLHLQYNLLPKVLQDIGYKTYIVGKWHLGFHLPEYTPTRRGFDSHYGFWLGHSDLIYHTTEFVQQVRENEYGKAIMYNVPDYETRVNMTFYGQNFYNGLRRVQDTAGKYLTDLYTDYSVKLIHKHDQRKPLFLYLAHHGVHRGNFNKPVFSPEKYTKLFTNIADTEHERKNFAGALTAIDRSLGEVMAALGRRKMLNNTIFVFSNENGSPKKGEFDSNGGSNYPLRGFKFSGWEGGVRGIAFIWSPLLKNQGTYDGLMYIADWLPTLYRASGQNNVSSLGKLDGHDLWDAVMKNTSSPRRDILLQSDPAPYSNNLISYRRGDYKIVSGSLKEFDPNGYSVYNGLENPPEGFLKATESRTAKALTNFYHREPKYMTNPIVLQCGLNATDPSELCDPDKAPCLFNIKEDPCEYHNIAKQNPMEVEVLLKYLNTFKVRKPVFPDGDFLANPDYFNSYWTPWDITTTPK